MNLDARSDRLIELRELVEEFGVLALGLPVLELPWEGDSPLTMRKYHVRDVLVVTAGAQDAPAKVVRGGPHAESVRGNPYSSSISSARDSDHSTRE